MNTEASESISEFHIHLFGAEGQPHQSSFEETSIRLEGLEKLYFEPDGSFVWARKAANDQNANEQTANDQGINEQVFGMIYDAAGQVQYCDMRGKCQRATFHALCTAISGIHEENGLKTLAIMRLPDSQWKDFQTFETETWP